MALKKHTPWFPFKDIEQDSFNRSLGKNTDAINLNTAFRQKFDEATVPEDRQVWKWDDGVKKWKPDDVETANNITIELTAGQVISALKVLTVNSSGKAIYADSSNLDHFSKVIGINKVAVVEDETVKIIVQGEIENNTWNWTLNNPLFLSTSGELTQTEPTSGFSLVIGYPITAKKIYVRISEAIKLI